MIGTSAAAGSRIMASLSSRRTTATLVAAATRGAPRIAVGPRRKFASYQPPNPPKQEKSSTYTNTQRAFYRDFGAPVAKVFLGALVTYQALYWGWLKLESLETKEEKNAEIASLEAQVRDLAKDGKKESK